MKCVSHLVRTKTHGRGFHDLTPRLRALVKEAGVENGLASVFVRHTSASLVIQENADPSVLRDLQRWMDRIAPEDPQAYEHDAEGPDDMPGHLRTAITRASETLPIKDGALLLGTWQAVYLWEHRRAHHEREVVMTLMGLPG